MKDLAPTTVPPSPADAADAASAAGGRRNSKVIGWLTATDHKVIGSLYLITSFAFFLVGGVMALLLRAELARPGLQIMTNEQFNQTFTMHGTVMLLMFATPLFSGFANWIMPLQIGAPDVAFPRLNMLAYWFYLFGSLITVGGFVTPQGAASLDGSSTRRCPTPHTAPGSVATCGSWVWPCPASAPSWAPSTSSRRSCVCVPRA